MMLWLFTIITILSLSVLWWWLSLEKRIPGPVPLPFLGNVLLFGTTPQEFLKTCIYLCKTYGGIFRIYVGHQLSIVISDADMAETILHSSKHTTKSKIYDLLKPVFRESLLTSNGERWRKRRKIITPTFSFTILHEFVKIFNETSDVLLEKLEEKVGQPFNIYNIIKLYSFDIICETAMGVKVNAQQEKDISYLRAMNRFFKITNRRFYSLLRFDAIFKRTSQYKVFNDALKVVETFIQSVIDRRRNENRFETDNNKVSEEGIRQKVGLLDTLLKHEELSDADLRDEISTFITAGHDSTMTAISFIVLALADHQDVQEKLYQEITSYFHPGDQMTINDLQSLTYLDMVIKESLRIYTILPAIERNLDQDTEIDGHVFKKDTTITIFIYGIHHSEKYYPDPEKFDPQRFQPGVERHPNAFLPFSAGPRNCMGQTFAMLELKLTIVKILLFYKILPVPGFKPDLGMLTVLHSSSGIYVNLEKRPKMAQTETNVDSSKQDGFNLI